MRNDLNQFWAFRMTGNLNLFPWSQLFISLGQFFINARLKLTNFICNIQPAVPTQMAQFFNLAFQSGNWLFKIKKVVHSIHPMFIRKIIGAYLGCFTCFSALLQAGARRLQAGKGDQSGWLCKSVWWRYPHDQVMSADCADLPHYSTYAWQKNAAAHAD